MSTDQCQVPASHYLKKSYLTQERWASYWHQIDLVRAQNPNSVLEIGVGNGIVCDMLKRLGFDVQTVDIDASLNPTHVASATSLPLPDKSVDVTLCAEVLEHLPFEESVKAMKEIHRVTKRIAIITLPHAGYTFSFIFKIPLLSWIALGFKLPHFWKTHKFNGEHYWETGKKGWPRKKIRKALTDNGFTILNERIYPDDPAHVTFLCS